MSNTDIRVVPGPANYFSHPGSLAQLDNFFTPEQLSRAVWIYGERAIEGARPFLPESFNAPGAKRLLFKGHCNGALAIRDVLLARSEEALADQQRGDQTQAFRDVVEAIIAGGGMVGGLMPVRRCILRSSTTPTSWCWWSRRSSLTLRRSICWQASAIRWRSGTKRWYWHLSRRSCR